MKKNMYGLTRTNETSHYTSDCGCDAEEVGDGRRVKEFILVHSI